LLQHLSSIFVLLSIVGTAFLGSMMRTLPFVLFGTYIAWFYLRFFQVKAETDTLKWGPCAWLLKQGAQCPVLHAK
jgi:hypothetical protein